MREGGGQPLPGKPAGHAEKIAIVFLEEITTLFPDVAFMKLKSKVNSLGTLPVSLALGSLGLIWNTGLHGAETVAPATDPTASGYVVSGFPILDALEKSKAPLDKETLSWMKRWRGSDLDEPQFKFNELSGSTSINLKVDREIDPSKADPAEPADILKSHGSFVPRNGAANPNTEIAYFNLAAILGWDRIYRPAIRYELGKRASGEFRRLIESTPIRGTLRLDNKKRILAAISAGAVPGALKAKKHDLNTSVDEMANTGAAPNGAPNAAHPIIMALQAGNPVPDKTKILELKAGYKNNTYDLAREYSVIMLLDAVFQQWDRYSGGNVVIFKGEDGVAHFYATDNGGADIARGTAWTERNLGWFSRYDRKTVEGLRKLHQFLDKPAENPYLGYTDPKQFVVDLGLYFELTPEIYVERLRRNLGLVMDRIAAVEKEYGNKAFLD